MSSFPIDSHPFLTHRGSRLDSHSPSYLTRGTYTERVHSLGTDFPEVETKVGICVSDLFIEGSEGAAGDGKKLRKDQLQLGGDSGHEWSPRVVPP